MATKSGYDLVASATLSRSFALRLTKWGATCGDWGGNERSGSQTQGVEGGP